MQGKKLTYEFIKGQFKKEGYTLLSKAYQGAHRSLDYICLNGHIHHSTWSNWQQGKRCSNCAGLVKKDIGFINSEFEKEGYKLLTTEYKNSLQKLEYVCSEGHIHNISWGSWQQGHRCPYCVGVAKKTIDDIRSEFKKEGYTLLSDKYVNSRRKLDYICSNNHKHAVNWDKWKQGVRCYYCKGTVKKHIKYIKDEMHKEGYVLLTNTYINSKNKLNYKCANNHNGSITWADWSQGRRCKSCYLLNNSGDRHWNWKGGISCEPYCDSWADKEFKKDILERDNYKCQNPDCWSTAAKLMIHHIDYNKKNCHPKNLITLCGSCNSRSNFNRKLYTKLYENIII